MVWLYSVFDGVCVNALVPSLRLSSALATKRRAAEFRSASCRPKARARNWLPQPEAANMNDGDSATKDVVSAVKAAGCGHTLAAIAASASSDSASATRLLLRKRRDGMVVMTRR